MSASSAGANLISCNASGWVRNLMLAGSICHAILGGSVTLDHATFSDSVKCHAISVAFTYSISIGNHMIPSAIWNK